MMITNACPQKGNEEWCTSPNRHGYKWHFDIAVPGNVPGLVGQNGWGELFISRFCDMFSFLG